MRPPNALHSHSPWQGLLSECDHWFLYSCEKVLFCIHINYKCMLFFSPRHKISDVLKDLARNVLMNFKQNEIKLDCTCVDSLFALWICHLPALADLGSLPFGPRSTTLVDGGIKMLEGYSCVFSFIELHVNIMLHKKGCTEIFVRVSATALNIFTKNELFHTLWLIFA